MASRRGETPRTGRVNGARCAHWAAGSGGTIRGVSKASTDVPEGFLTLDEAGPLIGLSPNRLREYAVAGRLHAVKWRGVWWTTIKHLAEFDAVPRRPGRRFKEPPRGAER